MTNDDNQPVWYVKKIDIPYTYLLSPIYHIVKNPTPRICCDQKLGEKRDIWQKLNYFVEFLMSIFVFVSHTIYLPFFNLIIR